MKNKHISSTKVLYFLKKLKRIKKKKLMPFVLFLSLEFSSVYMKHVQLNEIHFLITCKISLHSSGFLALLASMIIFVNLPLFYKEELEIIKDQKVNSKSWINYLYLNIAFEVCFTSYSSLILVSLSTSSRQSLAITLTETRWIYRQILQINAWIGVNISLI